MIEIDNAPWFMAGDVCKAVSIINTTRAVSHLGPDMVRRVERSTLHSMKGGSPYVFITESGLYKLVMRSDKPEAKAFQDWATGTVLPSIRKDGGYIKDEDDNRPDGLRGPRGHPRAP
ncbi:Bro-N domain-containing protein [Roseovarius sp. MS2]|uniref:BRO-N domain-containing protein n=1 Tax=Roseovarius sp. MS2 TaxID=3390728 RepID=UPI003EDCAFAA